MNEAQLHSSRKKSITWDLSPAHSIISEFRRHPPLSVRCPPLHLSLTLPRVVYPSIHCARVNRSNLACMMQRKERVASHQWKITRDTKGSDGIIRQIRIIIYSHSQAGEAKLGRLSDASMNETMRGSAPRNFNLPLSDEEHVLGLLADAVPLPADPGVGDVQRLRKPEVKPLSLPRLRYLAS